MAVVAAEVVFAPKVGGSAAGWRAKAGEDRDGSLKEELELESLRGRLFAIGGGSGTGFLLW